MDICSEPTSGATLWLQSRRRLLLAPVVKCDLSVFGLLSDTITFTVNKLPSVIVHIN